MPSTNTLMPSAGAIRKLADSPILSADTIRNIHPFFNPRIFTKGAKESKTPMPSGSRALPLMGEMKGASSYSETFLKLQIP